MPGRRFFLVSAAALPLLAHGAYPTPALPAGALQHDAALLHAILQRLHPGLHRYASKDAFDSAYRRLLSEAGTAPSMATAYLALSRYLSVIRCGHTYANFFNQKKGVREALFSAKNRLPFTFGWVGPRMVVTSGAPGLPRGSEVRGINGVASAELLASLLPLVRADGPSDVMKRSLLSVSGSDEIETFDVFFGLLHGAPRFEIAATLPGGRKADVTLDAIDLAQRNANRPKSPTSNAESGPWQFEMLAGGAGKLTMPGWALYKEDWNWRAYIARVFDRLAAEHATGLIIDLRNNEGGLDCGDEIIARLLDRPVRAELWEKQVRYRALPPEYAPYMDTWDDSFRNWGERVEPVPGRPDFLRFKPTEAEFIIPKGPRFRGRVAVLIDASNHSATLRFAMLMREYKLGKLIGAQTGGNQSGINGGAFFFVRLPQTGFEVDLPLIGYFSRKPVPDGGMRPDMLVPTTVADFANAKDRVMQRAIDWLGKT
ncbi:MAG: S41 family peptidase [Pseudomonadota bacterium]